LNAQTIWIENDIADHAVCVSAAVQERNGPDRMDVGVEAPRAASRGGAQALVVIRRAPLCACELAWPPWPAIGFGQLKPAQRRR
jgi:hypothetical protein